MEDDRYLQAPGFPEETGQPDNGFIGEITLGNQF